jgi:hypothetical protein
MDRAFMQVPYPAQQHHEFFHPQGGCGGVGHAVPVAHHPFGAVADAEYQSSVGEFVEVARLGGQHQGLRPTP